jgi:hypothetical protein
MWADETPPTQEAPRIATPQAAHALVAEVGGVMRELEKVLEVETAHLRAGRIRDGLSQEERKTALTSRYLQGLEALKANAVALARFAPEALERLKGEHAAFARTIETNQVVLATARAVSESLVRSLSSELDRGGRTTGYAPAGYGAPRPAQAGGGLVLSKSL